MKTLKLTSLTMALLAALTVAAQDEFTDDVYFSSGKSQKEKATEQPTATYAAPVAATTEEILTGYDDRDVDEYNRRYASAEETYEEDTVVIQNNQRTSDTEYSERIIRYHSPSKITIAGADQVDLYLSDGYYAYDYDTEYTDDGANVSFNINVGNGWYDPWYYGYSPWSYRYYSPWYYSSWYWPSWSWGWGGFYAGFYDPWYYPGYYYAWSPYRHHYPYYYPHYSDSHRYASKGRAYSRSGRSVGSYGSSGRYSSGSNRSSTGRSSGLRSDGTARSSGSSSVTTGRSSGSSSQRQYSEGATNSRRSSTSSSSSRSSSSTSVAPSTSRSSGSSSYSSSSGASRSSSGAGSSRSSSSGRSSGNGGGRGR